MKHIFIGLGLLALAAAGCSTDERPIVFLSEVKVPGYVENPSGSLKETQGLSKVDEQKIEIAVFSHLLRQKLWDNGDFSAIFLQADETVVDGMIRKFPHHAPPIKESSHLDLDSAKMPLDRDTGLPVLILNADIGALKPDGTVDVVGRWYAGSVVKGDATFTLKKAGEDWSVAVVQ